MGLNKVPQVHVRIPTSLREQLDEVADREHWSLNQAIIEAIKLLVTEK